MKKLLEDIMTEKEKMLNQMIYDANYDKELLEERVRFRSSSTLQSHKLNFNIDICIKLE